MNLQDFATERYPLRCSRLPDLMRCHWKVVMQFLEQNPRESRSAADTGSAAHKAVSIWHSKGKEVKAAIKAMKSARDEYPMADLLEAEKLFQLYCADPRNQEAKVVAVETLLQWNEGDIWFEGTTDQIREENDEWAIWDYKTSKKAGHVIRVEHTYQISGYAVGATRKYKRPVRPGGIIMGRQYPNREAYFPYDISLDQAQRYMAHVCDTVRAIRRGEVPPNPGEYCFNTCIGDFECTRKHKLLLGDLHGNSSSKG